MGQFKRKMHVTDKISGSLYIELKAEDNSRIVLHGVSWAGSHAEHGAIQ